MTQNEYIKEQQKVIDRLLTALEAMVEQMKRVNTVMERMLNETKRS